MSLGGGHDFFMSYVGARFMNAMSINSLSMRVPHFPDFSESIRLKKIPCWAEKDDGHGNETKDSHNSCENEGCFNTCGLIEISVLEVIRLGSGPVDEGHNQLRCPNACVKQRSIHARCKKIIGQAF